MHIGNMTALGQVATMTHEAPKDLGEQMEYMFAQQLLRAMVESARFNEAHEGGDYLSLLDDQFAREITKAGGLGISKQLGISQDSTPDTTPGANLSEGVQ